MTRSRVFTRARKAMRGAANEYSLLIRTSGDTPRLAWKPRVVVRLVSLAFVLVGLWLRPGARAATLTVDNLTDVVWLEPGSLRQVISDASPGDTIVFSVTGTINLMDYDLPISQDLTIAGPGAELLAISGRGSRIFDIDSTATVRIAGLTICNGKAERIGSAPDSPGGGIYNRGVLTLQDCVISNNAAGDRYGYSGEPANWPGGSGGGVYNAGSLTASNCVFTGNTSGRVFDAGSDGGNGGGICNAGTMNLVRCVITNNTTGPGSSGGYGAYVGSGGCGGGIMNLGRAVLNACAIYGNRTGMGCSNSSTGVTYGGSGGSGGGICSAYDAGGLFVTNCTIAGNSTGNGGGAYDPWGAWGGPGGWGGGLFIGTNSALVNCTITDNSTGRGGDAWAPVGWPPDAFSHGGDGGNGAGLASEAGGLVVACTIAGNATGVGGSGFSSSGRLGRAGAYGKARLWNCLVANTNANLTAYRDVDGGVTSLGHNLVGITNQPNQFTNQDLCGSASAPLDPWLAPLSDNGGPTTTCALQPGSPALDHGEATLVEPPWSLATDQRELPRTSGPGVDIGAYEVQWAASPFMASCTKLADGSLVVRATNSVRASLTVLASPDPCLTLAAWPVVGAMAEVTPGCFQFRDPASSSNSIKHFYRLRSP